MKKYIFPSLLIFLAVFLISWTPKLLPKINNQTFQKGEFLKYRVHYGLINAGYGTVWVDPQRYTINNRTCFRVLCKGFTNSAFDKIYKVRDRYESYIDDEYLVSWKFNRFVQEGKDKYSTHADFYHNKKYVVYRDHKNLKYWYAIKPGIQDIISAFYHARTTYKPHKMKVGDKISLVNFIDKKTFNLWAELKEKETIKLGGKKFKALRFKLLVEEAGLLTDGSDIEFWISDDANRIPLRIESKLMFGSVQFDLMEWKNLKHELKAQLK